jgi:hypothetical protein
MSQGSPVDNERLDAALEYAAAGLHVFPCRAGLKIPAVEHGFQEATQDPDRIHRWWLDRPFANVAISTGPSRLAIIDLDGEAGLHAWRDLISGHPAPRTPFVRTPSDGFHLYYRADPHRELHNSQSALGRHIDTRGVGGYVIAPPSQFEGRPYEFDGPGLDTARMAVIPGWVLDAVERPAPVIPTRSFVVDRVEPYLRRALEDEADLVRTAEEGTRNGQLNKSAFALGTLVGGGQLSRGDIEQVLTEAARSVGLPEREIERTLRSGLDAGVSRPRETRPRQLGPGHERRPHDRQAGGPGLERTS